MKTDGRKAKHFMKPGWRARIGLILPASLVVMEPEFYEMVPPGVSVHAARMRVDRASKDPHSALKQMESELEGAAARIKTLKPDIIAYCCTMGSFQNGQEGNKRLIQQIRDMTGVPTVTMSQAVVDAANALQARKMFVVTPYVEEINQEEKSFLEECGFEVLGIVGTNCLTVDDFLSIDPDDIYQLAIRNFKKEADSLFISCGGVATLNMIESLEASLDRPVICSDQATIWKTLKELDLFKPVEGYGKLFAESK